MANEKGYRVEEAEGPAQEVEVIDSGALAVLNKSEINQQIATAKEYPRSIKKFRDEAIGLVTINEKVAEECMYALPRGEKNIEGPSARFAEIIAYAWGNIRIMDRCIGEDEKHVTSQGIAFDVERNVTRVREVQRRITNKYGNRFNDDMIIVTKNANGSIAGRNATLAVIPKALWIDAYNVAREAAIGTVETLGNKRAAMVTHFQKLGVSLEMICRKMEVAGIEDIGLEKLGILKGIAQAIKEDELRPEEVFSVPDEEEIKSRGAAGLKDLLEGKKKAGKKKAEPEKAKEQGKEQEPERKTEPEKKEEPQPEKETGEPPAGEPFQKPEPEPEKEKPIVETVLEQIRASTAPDQLDKAIQSNIAEIKKMSEANKARVSEEYQKMFTKLNS